MWHDPSKKEMNPLNTRLTHTSAGRKHSSPFLTKHYINITILPLHSSIMTETSVTRSVFLLPILERMFQSVSTRHRDLRATGNACERFFFFKLRLFVPLDYNLYKNLCHEKNENIKVLFNLVRKLTKLAVTRNWEIQMRNKMFLYCFQIAEEINPWICQGVVTKVDLQLFIPPRRGGVNFPLTNK